MIRSNWLYIAVMFAVSYTIRILPLTLIRKPIKNRFIQSFLYYVPYVTLAVMTFPAIVNATQSPAAGAISLRQAYECWQAGADPIEFAKEHKEFARAFESFPGDADKLYPGWREKLGAAAAHK